MVSKWVFSMNGGWDYSIVIVGYKLEGHPAISVHTHLQIDVFPMIQSVWWVLSCFLVALKLFLFMKNTHVFKDTSRTQTRASYIADWIYSVNMPMTFP